MSFEREEARILHAMEIIANRLNSGHVSGRMYVRLVAMQENLAMELESLYEDSREGEQAEHDH